MVWCPAWLWRRRRVCAACRIVYVPSSTELARFGLSSSQNGSSLYKATLQPEEIQEASQRPTLLRVYGVGYKGVVACMKMRMTERLQNLVTEGAPTERIKEVAVEDGMRLAGYSLS